MTEMEQDFTDVYLEACTKIGDSTKLYYYKPRKCNFLEIVLSDNTLKSQPSNTYKSISEETLTTAAVVSGLLYGFPKENGFSRKMCYYAESAAMYNVYIRNVISHLEDVPKFLDEIIKKLLEIAEGKSSAENDFFQVCISLLRSANMLKFMIQAADAETSYFSDILCVNHLEEQINPVYTSISQLIGNADQIRACLKVGQNQTNEFESLKTNMSVLKNAIPNYTSLYSQLLESLQNKFCLKYDDNENCYKEFLLYLREIANPLHDILIYAVESSLYSFEHGINLIRNLKELITKVFLLVKSAIKLTRFRSEYSENVNKIAEVHENIAPNLNNTISGFMEILGWAPPIYQKIVNDFLTTKFQVILNLNNQFINNFNNFNNSIQNDENSSLFSPVSMARTSSSLTILAIPIIKSTYKISKKLMESDFDIEVEMHALVSTIPKLIENLNSKIDDSPKMFTRQSILQKKVLIRKALKEFVLCISKLQENKEQPLLQARCGLLALELNQYLMSFETHKKFIKYLDLEKQVLLQFAIGYLNERLSILPKLLNNLCSNLGISKSKSPINSLLGDTLELIKKSSEIFSNLPKDNQLESCKICLKQYMEINIPFSSLYLLLSTLNNNQNNKYNSVINIIENFCKSIELFVQLFQRLINLKLYHSYSILLKYGDKLISYMQLLNKFTSKTSNAGDKIKGFQTNITNSKIELKKVKINYLPDALEPITNTIKNKIKQFSEIKLLLNPESDVIPIFQKNFKKSLDDLNIILDNLSNDFNYFSELNPLKDKFDVTELAIVPLLLNTYSTVNQDLQTFMANFHPNNQDTSIFAYGLTSNLFSLAELLKKVNNDKIKKLPTYFEKYGTLIYEYSLISSLGDQNAFKRISTTTKSLIKSLTSLKYICEKFGKNYLSDQNETENVTAQEAENYSVQKVENKQKEQLKQETVTVSNQNSIESLVFSNLLQIQQQIASQSHGTIQHKNSDVKGKSDLSNSIKQKEPIKVEINLKNTDKENEIINTTINKLEDDQKIKNEFASIRAELESLRKAKEEEERKLLKIEHEKMKLAEQVQNEEQKRKEAENEKRKIEKMLHEQSQIDADMKKELKEKLKEAKENLKIQKEIEKKNQLITENIRINLQMEKENAELELINLQKSMKENYDAEIKSKNELNYRLKITEESKIQLEKELQQTIIDQKNEESQREKNYQELLEKLHQQNDEQQKQIVQLQINKQKEIDDLLKKKNKEKQNVLEMKISEQLKIKESLEEEKKKRKEIEEQHKFVEEEKNKIQKQAESMKEKLKKVEEENERIKNQAEEEKERIKNQAEEEKERIRNQAEEEKERIKKEAEEEKERLLKEAEKENISNEKINVISTKETDKSNNINEQDNKSDNLFTKLFPPPSNNDISKLPPPSMNDISKLPPLNLDLYQNIPNKKINPIFGPFTNTVQEGSTNNVQGNGTIGSYLPSKDSPFYNIIEPVISLAKTKAPEIKTSKFGNTVFALEPPQYQFDEVNLVDGDDIQDDNNEEEDLLFPDPFGDNDFEEDDFYDSIYDLDDEDEEEEEEKQFPFPFPPPKKQ